jgi:hypothetical protein
VTTTTTTTPTYQAVKDAAIKTWHLGSAERGHKTYCGVELMWPDDPRRFSQKVALADRHHEVSEDLTLIGCKACKRTREYGYATGTAERPAPTTGTTTRRRRAPAGTSGRASAAARRMADDAEAPGQAASPEAVAAVDPAEQVDGSAPRRRAARKSKATRAQERTAADAARRAETTGRADAALAAIDEALTQVSPE